MNTEALNALALTVVLLPGVLSDGWTVRLPAGPVLAARGSTVTVPCRYGYPDPGRSHRVLSVMWCRDQARCITPRYVYHSAGILPEPAYLGRAEYLGDAASDCTLKISGLRASDSGTYVFRFITDHPVENLPDQAGVVLLVSDSTSQVSVSVTPSGEIVEGSSVTLTCSSAANPPVQRYTWYKNNRAVSSETGGPKDSYIIKNITLQDAGEYYCAAENGIGTNISPPKRLDVQYAPKKTSVSVSPSGEIVEGSSVTLTCSSDANPPVQRYTWFKKNDTVVWQAGSGQSLNLSNFRSWNRGEYYCEAQNRLGAQSASALLVLIQAGRRAPTEREGGADALVLRAFRE